MTVLPAIYDETFTKRLLISDRVRLKPPVLVQPTLGIAFPFYPTLWSDNEINKILAIAKELVHAKLKEKYSTEDGNKMLVRVENIFNKLDFNTHRKSVAIILEVDAEKITYLDFTVKPTVITGKQLSLLDLTTNLEKKEEFLLLVLEKGRKRLLEYNGNKLHTVFEQLDEGDSAELYKKTYQVIELLNSNNEKPVFVTGQPNLVELFCLNPSWSKIMFTFLYRYHSFSTKTLNSFVHEITRHWNYWHTKFITGKILIAQETSSMVTNIKPVTAALNKKANGLLMIDKWLSKCIKEIETLNEKTKNSFVLEVENFLARGNRVLFTDAGLVKNSGAVVLLYHQCNSTSNTIAYAKNKNKSAVNIDF